MSGPRSITAWVDTDAVNEQLSEHVDGGPQVAATDGGIIDDDGRPDDCDRWDADGELPCWPCCREGFGVPSPDEPGADE